MGRAEMPPIFKPGELQRAQDTITGLNSQLDKTRESLSFIASSFTDAVNELSKGNKYLSNTKSSLNSLAGIANTLKVEAQDLNTLSDKRLLGLEKRAKIQFETLKIAKQGLKVNSEAYLEAQSALKSEKEFLEVVKQIRLEKKLINDSTGVRVFGGLEALTDAIPGLKKLTPVFKEASEEASAQAASNLKNYGNTRGKLNKEQLKINAQNLKNHSIEKKSLESAAKSGKKLTASKIKQLGLDSKLISKSGGKLAGTSASAKAGKLLKNLPPPKAIKAGITPLKAGFQALGGVIKKAFLPLSILMEVFSLDKQITEVAKGMNMTYKEATQVRAEMQSIANSSGNNFISGKKLLETFQSINKTLGTTGKMMDEEMLISLTEMREMAGFTNEELQGIAAISLATGKSVNDVTGEFMAQAKISSIQNGVLLNEKDLVKDIGKVSAATTLSFGKQPGLIAGAVATAKSLGMELSKVDAIASSLLNFESSIEAELQAELLLGKDINLEKARQAALNNDLATVAEEIAKQAGSAAEFGEMNRIQQEALAKAVGMGREELASTLFLQEQLVGLSGKEAEQAEADFQRRVAVVGIAQAQRELEKEGVDGLRQQAGMADRLAAAMDKVNEVFVSLIEPLMPILDIFMGIFSILGPIMKLLNPFIQFAATGFSAIADVLTGLTGGGFGFENTKTSVKRTEDASQAVFGTSADIYGRYGNDGELKMAKGGIVTGPTRAIVGEAGPEAVIPLSTNTPAINVDMSATNALLTQLVKKTPEMAPLGLYEVQ